MKKFSIIIFLGVNYFTFIPYVSALIYTGPVCPESTNVILASPGAHNDCQCQSDLNKLGGHGISKYVNGSCNYTCDAGYNLTNLNSCVLAQPAALVEPQQSTSVVTVIPPATSTTNNVIDSLQVEVEALKKRIELLESQKITPITQHPLSKPELVKTIEKKVIPVEVISPKATNTPIKTVESQSIQQEEKRQNVLPLQVKIKSIISKFLNFFF